MLFFSGFRGFLPKMTASVADMQSISRREARANGHQNRSKTVCFRARRQPTSEASAFKHRNSLFVSSAFEGEKRRTRNTKYNKNIIKTEDMRLGFYTKDDRECRRYAKHIKARGASERASKPLENRVFSSKASAFKRGVSLQASQLSFRVFHLRIRC